MALPSGFLDELRARTPLGALVGRRVKLARSGRNWKGCCPFHNERTPSFYVYEDGYHCFGCGAHGDAISFVMQTQGAGFMEAVKALADEAGLEVPAPSPGQQQAERRRHDLASVLAAVEAAYRRRLHEREGAAALAYLRGRGLSDETISRFGLGWSGEGRGALAAELARDGILPALLEEAGLLRPAEEGMPARELFWNRVMFPIRDRRGGTISFGGRTLGDGQPKYVNGPETPVFSKRRTLYGLDLAREGARKGAAVLAVEGYMDVIALHQAGFAGAVAPLGTALTAEQLEALWGLSPSPVLCFDGDAAGRRAALRAMDLALPLLAPDRTLRIASLPQGEDPDTLVRRRGREGFQPVLDGARPLADALFAAVQDERPGSGPEQRAAFRRTLEEKSSQIADKALASEYRRALLDRFYALRAGPGRGGGGAGRRGGFAASPKGAPFPPKGAMFGGIALPVPARPAPSPDSADAERLRCMTAILLRHPALLRDVEEAYAGLDLPSWLGRVREAIQQWFDHVEVLDSAGLIAHLTGSGLTSEVAQILGSIPMPLPGCAAPDAMPAAAEAGWWELYGRMHRDRLEEEVAAAGRAFAETADTEAERRLTALARAREALRRGEQGDADP